MIVYISIQLVNDNSHKHEHYQKEYSDAFLPHFALSKQFLIGGFGFVISNTSFDASKLKMEIFTDTITDKWIDIESFRKRLSEEGWKQI